jgi:hypothetical protein
MECIRISDVVRIVKRDCYGTYDELETICKLCPIGAQCKVNQPTEEVADFPPTCGGHHG